MTPNELTDFVRSERKRQHMTQEQLSKRCGVQRYFICDLEKGKYKRGPSIETCERLLTALGYRLTITRID